MSGHMRVSGYGPCRDGVGIRKEVERFSLVRTCVVVAVIVPSSQRHWLAAEQWFTAQIVAELLQEAQHIRHTVYCRQSKCVLLLVKVGCRAIGQRPRVSQQCTITQ